jgi:hypothetical protein
MQSHANVEEVYGTLRIFRGIALNNVKQYKRAFGDFRFASRASWSRGKQVNKSEIVNNTLSFAMRVKAERLATDALVSRSQFAQAAHSGNVAVRIYDAYLARTEILVATFSSLMKNWIGSTGEDAEKCETRFKNQLSILPNTTNDLRSLFSNTVAALWGDNQTTRADEMARDAVKRRLYRVSTQLPGRSYDPSLRAVAVWRPAGGEDAYVTRVCSALESGYEDVMLDLRPLLAAELKTCNATSHFRNESFLQDRLRMGWKELYLYTAGQPLYEAQRLAPRTLKLLSALKGVPSKRGGVYFSLMRPGTIVRPHTGSTNKQLRAHLTLVAEPPESGAKLFIDDYKTPLRWQVGKCFAFDDSFKHEVKHEGKEIRVVLVVDFDHPDLT